jgi:hypothetical protein
VNDVNTIHLLQQGMALQHSKVLKYKVLSAVASLKFGVIAKMKIL